MTTIKYAKIPVTPFEQNCSVVVCKQTNKAAITDPGGDLDKIIQFVEKTGVMVEKILITHGHLDHCGGTLELAKRLQVPIEGPHEADRFWIDQLAEQSKRFGFDSNAMPFESDRWLNGGDTVTVGNQLFQVEHCPGHTPGHVVFIHEAGNLAMVGDVLFAGSIGRTDFPRGNHQDLIDSIKNNLFKYGDAIEFIPGHGPNSTFGEERLHNPHLQGH